MTVERAAKQSLASGNGFFVQDDIIGKHVQCARDLTLVGGGLPIGLIKLRF